MHTKFWLTKLKEKDHLENRGNIRKHLRETGGAGVEWIILAENMVQRRAIVNIIMELWIPKKARNFLTSRLTTIFLRILLYGSKKFA